MIVLKWDFSRNKLRFVYCPTASYVPYSREQIVAANVKLKEMIIFIFDLIKVDI